MILDSLSTLFAGLTAAAGALVGFSATPPPDAPVDQVVIPEFSKPYLSTIQSVFTDDILLLPQEEAIDTANTADTLDTDSPETANTTEPDEPTTNQDPPPTATSHFPTQIVATLIRRPAEPASDEDDESQEHDTTNQVDTEEAAPTTTLAPEDETDQPDPTSTDQEPVGDSEEADQTTPTIQATINTLSESASQQ